MIVTRRDKLLERRRWAFSYAEQMRQGLTLTQIAAARGIPYQAVQNAMTNACPAFMPSIMSIRAEYDAMRRQMREKAAAAGPAHRVRPPPVIVPFPLQYRAKPPKRPAWSRPDQTLLHAAHEARDEIRTKERTRG